MNEPRFDPHAQGKLGCLAGAVATIVVIALLIWML
jgi:hypothetical protein